MRTLLAALLFALPAIASADPVGGFVRGGLSLTGFEEEDSFGNRIELDGGGGINLTGGVRFEPGLSIKGAWTHSEHDGGEYDFPGLGSGTFEEDSEIDEFRFGVYYEPPMTRMIGFRAGGGYEGMRVDIPALTYELEFDGVFVEGAVLFKVGRIVTFDAGLAFMGLEDNFDQDAGGAEIRFGALFDTGPLDIEVVYRGLNINTEYDFGGGDVDDTFGELRVSIGGAWGYPD